MALGHYALPALEGDRVRWTRRRAETAGPWARAVVGEGTFVRCWLGVAEVWDVRLDDGSTVHVYPELGDTMERVED